MGEKIHGVPHGILRVLNTILYENDFQNPQNFHQRVRFLESKKLKLPAFAQCIYLYTYTKLDQT
jgi:hypothetical protein